MQEHPLKNIFGEKPEIKLAASTETDEKGRVWSVLTWQDNCVHWEWDDMPKYVFDNYQSAKKIVGLQTHPRKIQEK